MQQRTIEGIIEINKRGPAIIRTDDGEEFQVHYNNLNQSLPKDRVKATIFAGKKKKHPDIEVEEIIQRARTQFVGTVEITKKISFFVSDSANLPVDIIIPQEEITRTKVQKGQKVIVKIKSWDKSSHNPTGEIVKVLGNAGEHNVEMHSILAEFDLPYEFSEEIEKEADKINNGITPKEISNRRDMRTTTTFTIDPADAKDFDDAISIKEIDENLWEIGVHIADVSFYIEQGSKLDVEAFQRGTSVYLVDRVVPMLPEKLSNNLCSLQPFVEKLTYSVVFQMDNSANVKKYWIGRTVIKSDRQFSYEEAQKNIETQSGDFAAELLTCHKLAQQLRKQRFSAGSIKFERQEVKFELDNTGKPIGVFLRESTVSTQLIEEFMLLANRIVAEHVNTELKTDKQPKTFVYRVHDKPVEDKITQFAKFVKRFGYEINTANKNSISSSINKLLNDSIGKAWQNVVETIAIRSMAKAEYTTKNIGHYGLAYEFYSHFTSPIRRYPDIIAHRLLTEYLDGNKSANQTTVENACKHCNQRENLAVSAERASIKYKQVEYLQEHIEEEYDGVISGVTAWGMYVELLDNSCEGMIAANTLDDDWYIYDEDQFRLIGKNFHKSYQLGDKIRVRIVRADLVKKQIDFELVKSYSKHGIAKNDGNKSFNLSKGYIATPSRKKKNKKHKR